MPLCSYWTFSFFAYSYLCLSFTIRFSSSLQILDDNNSFTYFVIAFLCGSSLNFNYKTCSTEIFCDDSWRKATQMPVERQQDPLAALHVWPRPDTGTGSAQRCQRAANASVGKLLTYFCLVFRQLNVTGLSEFLGVQTRPTATSE